MTIYRQEDRMNQCSRRFDETLATANPESQRTLRETLMEQNFLCAGRGIAARRREKQIFLGETCRLAQTEQVAARLFFQSVEEAADRETSYPVSRTCNVPSKLTYRSFVIRREAGFILKSVIYQRRRFI